MFCVLGPAPSFARVRIYALMASWVTGKHTSDEAVDRGQPFLRPGLGTRTAQEVGDVR